MILFIDIVAQALPNIYWYEAIDSRASAFKRVWLTTDTSDEGTGAGDIAVDGDMDIAWGRRAPSDYGNLHEGMDVGGINGDGLTDILADAHIFYNPSSDLKNEWRTENLDEKWNTQTGDWSRNGTKAFQRRFKRWSTR